MPYNGSGTFIRNYNWVNDAASSIPITASRMDADSNDFASGLSNCVTRDGQGGFSTTINANNQLMQNLAVGSSTTPSLSFFGMTSTGIYSPAAGQVGITAAGSEQAAFSSSGVSLIQPTSNLTFASTGQRILADFTNATPASRLLFQTSTASSPTSVGAIPTSGSTLAYFSAYNSSSAANCAQGSFGADSSGVFANSAIIGAGTLLPLQLRMGGTAYLSISTTGQVLVGPAASGGASLSITNTPALGGLSVAGAAWTPVVTLTYGTTTTLDCSLSNAFRVVLTGNITTFTINNPQNGQPLNIRFKQDGSGSRTIAWPSSFRWANGAAPLLSTSPNAEDFLSAQYDSSDGTFVASLMKSVQ